MGKTKNKPGPKGDPRTPIYFGATEEQALTLRNLATQEQRSVSWIVALLVTEGLERKARQATQSEA